MYDFLSLYESNYNSRRMMAMKQKINISRSATKLLDLLVSEDDSITKEDIVRLKNNLITVSGTLYKAYRSENISKTQKTIGIISAIALLLPLDMLNITPETAKFIDDIIVMTLIFGKGAKRQSKK